MFKKSFKKISSNYHSGYDVIIVGFSKSALPIIKILEENDVNYVVIERNLSKIGLAQSKKINITYGDLFNHQILSTLNVHSNTVVFINFSLMGHHITNLVNFRRKYHTTKLIALANLESESLQDRFNVEIITNPYLDQSIHAGKTILQNLHRNWKDADLDDYLEDFKERWEDNERPRK